jgi:predicted transcriptional regulator
MPDDPNALLQRILMSQRPPLDEIPPGWLDVPGWAQEFGLSQSHTHKILNVGVKSGIMERRTFNAGDRPHFYYAEKKPNQGRRKKAGKA